MRQEEAYGQLTRMSEANPLSVQAIAVSSPPASPEETKRSRIDSRAFGPVPLLSRRGGALSC